MKLKTVINEETFRNFHKEGQLTPFVRTDFKKYLKEIGEWTITFGDNLELEMGDRMYKTLIFGMCEFIGGNLLCKKLGMNVPQGENEKVAELDIPTNFGNRGGMFNAEVNMLNRTAHITGWLSGGFFDENPEPLRIFQSCADGLSVQTNEISNLPIHRNAPCPCGSGLAYRRCCKNKA